MRTSSLAERLEQFEATLASLRMRGVPELRLFEGEELPPSGPRRVRRARPGIRIRDQGLRPFRVF